MVLSSDRARNIFNREVITSEESSESEFVEEEKPWPPTQDRLSRSRAQKQASRVPRPHSHLFRLSGGRARGSKHARRWENSMFLTSLLQDIPEEEVDEAATILPAHHTPFSKLHSSDKHMQMWCSFSSRSEEEQHLLTRGGHCTGLCSSKQLGCGQSDAARPTPEMSFRKVDSRIRAVLQHNRHLPRELVDDLEEELRLLLSLDPRAVVLFLQMNPFYRLLLHGVCQYIGLQSTTVHCNGGAGAVVVVECGGGIFLPPGASLTSHLHLKEALKH